MNSFVIKNIKIIGEKEIYEGLFVECDGGIIKKVSADCCQSNAIDGGGLYLAPGLIDMHIHGLLGKCFDNGADELCEIASNLPKFGVTGFLPTIAPCKAGEDATKLKILSQTKTNGAEILGFHLEGPFLSRTGALPTEAIGKADKKRVQNLIDAARPYKAIFSISPEFEGIENLLPIMTQNNTPAFITHTAADVEQTLRAISLGACHATHFYDVFYSPPETDPGVRPCGAVEAILASPDVSVDFILDGEHVNPVAVKMALECKGSGGVCLVSDAAPVAAAEPGIYDFAGSKVQIKHSGAPARKVNGGGLAGSGLTMDKAVANAVKMIDADICLAVKMASANPAKVLGLEEKMGKIKEGFVANMILFDEKFQVHNTWINGIEVYKNK